MTQHHAEWSESLTEATRAAIDELAVVPAHDFLPLKNIDGRFATLSIQQLLAGNLTLVDRKSYEETVFADTEELIRAGWAID